MSSPGVSRDSGASFSGYTPDIVIGVAADTPLRYDPDDDPGKGIEHSVRNPRGPDRGYHHKMLAHMKIVISWTDYDPAFTPSDAFVSTQVQ